jgi:hypothetical protein
MGIRWRPRGPNWTVGTCPAQDAGAQRYEGCAEPAGGDSEVGAHPHRLGGGGSAHT